MRGIDRLRIRVRAYTLKEANEIMHFCHRMGHEGVTNDSYRDCNLFAWDAFNSDNVCYICVQLLKHSSIRVSNAHDPERKKYLEVSKSKLISEIEKLYGKQTARFYPRR